MNLNEVIEWCNKNQGFIDVLLSMLTLIVSIIAIIISIITAKNPYKRKLTVSCGTTIGIGNNLNGLHITAINIGNIPVLIKNIGIKVKNNVIININTIEKSRVMLKPSETTTQYFWNNDLMILNEIEPYRKLYAYVEDTEGRKYKKYIGKGKNIQRYILAKI